MTRDEKNAWERARWHHGKETRSAWFLKKKKRKRIYDANYRKINSKKKRASDAKWRANNRERWLANSRNWKLRNPEKHKQHVREAGRRYLKAHPEKNLAWVHTYRARKMKATSDTVGVRQYIKLMLDAAPLLCTYCRILLPRKRITFDHIIPISRGGLNTPGNMCPSCKPCNCRKNNRLPSEMSA